jgi:quercetin dioxygenase-like cupin family protein
VETKRSGSQPSAKGPAETFTGAVRIDPLFNAPAPARSFGAYVTFEPGARTGWHTHPLGQTLIVTAGVGLVIRDPHLIAHRAVTAVRRCLRRCIEWPATGCP